MVGPPPQGIVRLPEIEGYPLGPSTPGALNYALENDNAALLIACYGREGGPVAAKKYVRTGVVLDEGDGRGSCQDLYPLLTPDDHQVLLPRRCPTHRPLSLPVCVLAGSRCAAWSSRTRSS